MGRFHASFLFLAVLLALLLGACSPTSNAGFIRRTSSEADDHIMYDRAQPETFGHKRLVALSKFYPDLGVFLARENFPEFHAETSKGENRYLVLYYLAARNAYACRSGEGRSRQMEFSGPYPITEKEFRTLDDIRRKANTAP